MKNKQVDLLIRKGHIYFYEYFNNDIGNKNKKWCLSTSEGYFNFTKEKDLLKYLKDLGLDLKKNIKEFQGGEGFPICEKCGIDNEFVRFESREELYLCDDCLSNIKRKEYLKGGLTK